MMLLAAVALLLYGGDLPNVARSWGKSLSEFRRGLSGIQNEINDVIYSEPERLEYHQETSDQHVASTEATDTAVTEVEETDAEVSDTEGPDSEVADTGVPNGEASDSGASDFDTTLTEVGHPHQEGLKTGEGDVPDGSSEPR
jgi:Sec-independent protein translocase protein TatA